MDCLLTEFYYVVQCVIVVVCPCTCVPSSMCVFCVGDFGGNFVYIINSAMPFFLFGMYFRECLTQCV